MKIKEFVEQYKAAQDSDAQEQLVKSVIKRKYVPFLEKVSVLSACLESAVSEKNGLQIIDNIAWDFNKHIAMISLYTSLEFDSAEEDKLPLFNGYDALCEINVIEEIETEIWSDIYELQQIADAKKKNIEYGNSMVVQLSEQVTRFGTLISVALKPLSDSIVSEIANMSDEEKEAAMGAVLELIKK